MNAMSRTELAAEFVAAKDAEAKLELELDSIKDRIEELLDAEGGGNELRRARDRLRFCRAELLAARQRVVRAEAERLFASTD